MGGREFQDNTVTFFILPSKDIERFVSDWEKWTFADMCYWNLFPSIKALSSNEKSVPSEDSEPRPSPDPTFPDWSRSMAFIQLTSDNCCYELLAYYILLLE